jgi:lipoate-protein ligase B|uniref:Lipoate-protein ligase B n=1 Tax=Cyanidiaceae sp. MX-AZ01 TaxID=1503164 RepID=A0A060AE69_9RHOD|nr:lipoate-protein ligase B [Cyanidiaceae sp. MX-AZ01]
MTIHLSLSSFELTWMWQKSITFRDAHFHLICQHPIVYTLGHAAYFTYPVKNANRHRIDRGGEIAYHDGGHLLFYALTSCKQLDQHLQQLYLVASRPLRAFRLSFSIHQGIWLNQFKWMSIGIKVIRFRRCFHGFCLPIEGYIPMQFNPCHITSTYLVNLEAFLVHVSFSQCRYYLSISAEQNFSRHF